MSNAVPTTTHGTADYPRIATMTRRSELLGEGLQIRAPDLRAAESVQARRINDAPDFLADPIGSPGNAAERSEGVNFSEVKGQYQMKRDTEASVVGGPTSFCKKAA